MQKADFVTSDTLQMGTKFNKWVQAVRTESSKPYTNGAVTLPRMNLRIFACYRELQYELIRIFASYRRVNKYIFFA